MAKLVNTIKEQLFAKFSRNIVSSSPNLTTNDTTKTTIEPIINKDSLSIKSDTLIDKPETSLVDKKIDKKLDKKKSTVVKSNNKSKSTEKKDTPTNPDSDIVIFMAGRDEPPTYKPFSDQIQILKSGLSGKTLISYRYTEITKVLKSIKQNPNATVILFSAGCSLSNLIAKSMNNTTKLFIVEPYAIDAATVRSVRAAVDKYNVPRKNVCVGSTKGRGAGIIEGATEMPTLKGGVMASHWNALKMIGKLI